MSYPAFSPTPGGTKVVSASGTNTATTVDKAPAVGPWQCIVYNATAVTAFVSWGAVAATATTDMPLAAGASTIITVPENASRVVNVILASSTGNVYLTPGVGY